MILLLGDYYQYHELQAFPHYILMAAIYIHFADMSVHVVMFWLKLFVFNKYFYLYQIASSMTKVKINTRPN